jgi:tetratricopeptide (TPR) repeat protein
MLHRDWNIVAADRGIEQAIQADPSDARDHLVAAMVKAAAGRYEESFAAARRAIEHDPANWRVRSDLAYFLLAAGHFEEAFAESQAVLALEPEFAPALDFLLASGEHLGRYDEARAAAVKLMERSRAPESDIRAVQQACAKEGVRRYRLWQVRFVEEKGKRAWPAMTVASIYASAGRADEAFTWLRRAYEGRDMNLVFLGASPDFAGVRNDPRYAEMLKMVGLLAPLPRS